MAGDSERAFSSAQESKRYRAKRQTIRRIVLGDLRHQITIKLRNLKALSNPNQVDPTEDFTTSKVVWAYIDTKKGAELFDGVSTVYSYTHTFIIRYISSFTEEKWIEYQGNRYDIIDVESYDERNLFMRLTCRLRGLASKDATQA
jgi:SPP1 family predicted phage head-tail adaptor